MGLRLATCRPLLPAFHDDVPLFQAFARRGIQAEGVAWQDIDGDEPVAIRSTWDYTQDLPGFLDWFDRLDRAGAVCLNPTKLMRWNLDKRYLLELQDAGHAIVPTHVLDRFEPETVAAITADAGWNAAVAKPVRGAGAEGLIVVGADGQVQDFDPRGNTWAPETAREPQGMCLVQPRLDAIRRGEWSLFYFAGTYSHAVLKLPAAGDIRIQEEHGGTSHAADPPEHVRRAADAIAADQPDATYARVDGVDDGGFLLMELELIEPELYFRYHPPAVERFVDAVAARL